MRGELGGIKKVASPLSLFSHRKRGGRGGGGVAEPYSWLLNCTLMTARTREGRLVPSVDRPDALQGRVEDH